MLMAMSLMQDAAPRFFLLPMLPTELRHGGRRLTPLRAYVPTR
jgi:hypothetical protein